MSEFGIRGAGGKSGGGATESPNSVRTTQIADVLDLISEGECLGLTNGLQSIYLDGVPVQAADMSFNFSNVQVAVTLGTQGQPAIAGTDGVLNEIAVATPVLATTPIVRTISTPTVDTVRVTIGIPQLSQLDTGSGDLHGASFTWAIEIQSNGGGYVEVMREAVNEKSMSQWTIQKRIELPGVAPWDVRVKRITADSSSSTLVNAFTWSSYTEITSVKLRYPNSAMVRTRIDARQFARVPVRSFDWMGIKIPVPTNYDPMTRVYTGVWDGTFKMAWSDNPAWIYHCLVRNERFGLGRYIAASESLKWDVYRIGRYCDVMVPDGRGGLEPRFRCGLSLTTRAQAYKVLNDLAAIFMGMTYWLNTDVALVQDAPSDPIALFTPSNVIGGKFTYAGSSNSQRHTSAIVWYNALAQQGKLVPEVVPGDPLLEARLGSRPLELSPLGIWSRGQAQRVGKWALYTEQFATQTVAFRVGLDGVLVPPGKVFQVADPKEAGERLGGRIVSATASQITLDAAVTLAANETYTISVMLQDPDDSTKLVIQERAVSTPAGTFSVVDLAVALSAAPAPQSVWMLQSDNIVATSWYCLSLEEVKETSGTQFEITAIVHTPEKYDLIEQGIQFDPKPVSRLSPVAPPVASIEFTETIYKVGSVARSRMAVSWPQPAALGLTYVLNWRLNGAPWTPLAPTSANTVEISALASGLLEVTVVTVNSLGNASTVVSASVTVRGDQTPASDPQNFTATVVQGGVKFEWTPCPDDLYLASTLKVDGVVRFEGSASSYTWPWPALGTYDVRLTHWTTSLRESLIPALLEVTVDDGVETQWEQLAGRPKAFRVVARGANDTASPVVSGGLYDGETGGGLEIATRSYLLVRIRRSDGEITFAETYDVYFNGDQLLGSAADLAAALNATGPEYIVVVCTWDEPQRNRLANGLDAAMYRCGASRAVFGSPQFEYRSAYLLIGIGGCGEGNGYEAYQGDAAGDTNAWCDASFSLLKGNFTVGGSTSTPRSLADYSYTGDLNATNGAPTGTLVGGVLAEHLVDLATTAAETASDAAADAAAALAGITGIASDNVLSAVEKSSVIVDYTVLTNEEAGIVAQAVSYGVSASTLAYQAAITALSAYLGSLTTPTTWNDPTGNTTIVGTTFRANFSSAYQARQAVLNDIAAQARAKITAAGTLSLLGRGNAVVDGNTITKVGGAASWDSDAYSSSGFTGGAFASAVAAQASDNVMFGLNVDPANDSSYASIDFAIYLRADAVFDVYEGGSAFGDFGSYASGDVFAVTYDGSAVRYSRNGFVFRSVAVPAGLTLFFDSSFHSPGGALTHVQFGPLTDISGALAAASTASDAAAAAQSSANAALTQLGAIASDNVLSASEKSSVILDYTVLSGEQAGIDSQAVAYSIGAEKSAYDAAVTALTAYLNSLVSPTSWNDLAGDTSINGVNFRSVFGSAYSARQSLLDTIAIAAKAKISATATLSLIARVNCVVDGNTITKVGGNSAWDSDAYSTNGYTGGAFASAVAAQSWADIMFGLNTDPTLDAYFGSLDFAVYLNADGLFQVYENGGPASGVLAYAPGDFFAVTYDGATVRYSRNGSVFRSVAAPPGLQLYFDSSFYSPSGALTRVQFGPLADVSGALAAAAAASSAASLAQGAASSALIQLVTIADDNVLSAGEKPAVILDYTVLSGEQSGIDAQAATYSIGAEKAAYDAAVAALSAYLSGLVSPTSWNNPAGDTSITGTTFRATFASVYAARQALLDAVSIAAKARLGALSTLNTVGTSQVDSNAATDVYTDTWAGGSFTLAAGTNTYRTFSVTPLVDSTIEFTATIGCKGTNGDSGIGMAWRVTPTGGSAVNLGGSNSNDGTKLQTFAASSSFAAYAGVALLFEIVLSNSSGGHPVIALQNSTIRPTAVKR